MLKRFLRPTTKDTLDPEAKEIILKAREEAQKIREEALKLEQKIVAREEALRRKEEELEKLREKQIAKLEKMAQLTKEEARQQILKELEGHLKEEVARRIKEAEELIKERADERARDILVSTMQQAATDYVAEYTVSTVKLPNEEIKGRIIGKDGRNIKALEKATGVDFDLDSEPDEVRLSSFDPFRREVARLTLERLIADGRIQPARIEETVEKVKKELEEKLREEGEQYAYDAGVHGLPPEIHALLGRFKLRTSYGQNLAQHSLEVMNLAKYIAAEVGANVELTKKAALLHDLGKVLTGEMEGSHTRIGRRIMEKHGFDEKLINAAQSHHEEEEFKSVEAVIVYIADAISGARPGARFENYEAYVKRMREFEDVAKSFPGVAEAYALSAGRELRVVLKPEETDDATVTKLAHDIADKIHKTLTYPGQVKVTVLREVRGEEVAL